jgi:Protein of unknown function (DUF3489)
MRDTRSEAQRLMLREAAKREDRFLQPPANARAAAVRTLGGRLIDAGWVKEIKARNGAPIWRKDTASGDTYALKLIAKGLKAATAMIEAADGESAPLVTPASKTKTPGRCVARQPRALTPAPDALGGEPWPIQTCAPRPTSKLARVLDMLAADAGATIGDLTAATGWLEHTTRAALTGLRHRGYELSRTRKEGDVASVYRIVSPGEGAAR